MSNHTPGPWRVSPEFNGTFIRAVHGGLVASCEAGSQAMRTFDARLIAAAPELLEALEDCVESLLRLPNVDGAYRLTCLKQARDAIAKARGASKR